MIYNMFQIVMVNGIMMVNAGRRSNGWFLYIYIYRYIYIYTHVNNVYIYTHIYNIGKIIPISFPTCSWTLVVSRFSGAELSASAGSTSRRLWSGKPWSTATSSSSASCWSVLMCRCHGATSHRFGRDVTISVHIVNEWHILLYRCKYACIYIYIYIRCLSKDYYMCISNIHIYSYTYHIYIYDYICTHTLYIHAYIYK